MQADTSGGRRLIERCDETPAGAEVGEPTETVHLATMLAHIHRAFNPGMTPLLTGIWKDDVNGDRGRRTCAL
jgi:hypothetical protein